jgi:hypothetical protein
MNFSAPRIDSDGASDFINTESTEFAEATEKRGVLEFLR